MRDESIVGLVHTTWKNWSNDEVTCGLWKYCHDISGDDNTDKGLIYHNIFIYSILCLLHPIDSCGFCMYRYTDISFIIILTPDIICIVVESHGIQGFHR